MTAEDREATRAYYDEFGDAECAMLRALADHWQLHPREITNVSGGRNSLTWRVEGPGATYAAKLIRPGDSDPDQFLGGLVLARSVNAVDFPTPDPVVTNDGALAVDLPLGRLGLCRWIEGRVLRTDRADDVDNMGATLALLHTRLDGVSTPDGVPTWPWRWLDLDGLGGEEPEDIDLVGEAAAAAAVGRATGLLHGDPTPQNFIASNGAVALLDWASVLEGPVLYDLAVLGLELKRAGSPPQAFDRLVRAYRSIRAITDDEYAQLPVLRRLRYAAELVYFTTRARIEPRAPSQRAEDAAGLARARAGLRQEHVQPTSSRGLAP